MKGSRILSSLALGAADNAEVGAHDLGILADELFAIANELRRHDRVGSGTTASAHKDRHAETAGIAHASVAVVPGAGTHDPSLRTTYAAAARKVYSARRSRAAIFGNSEIFGEPAWDILLDLYIAHSDNKPVSVSSACIGSAAPSTTGLRWLGVLSDCGLVEREHDKDDQRRVLVRLTERGIAAMDEFFAQTLAAA